MSDILIKCRRKNDGVIDNLESNLRQIRTGRASGQMLERVQVEYYGAMTPINQMARFLLLKVHNLLLNLMIVQLLKILHTQFKLLT